jgi:DNA-binding NarL/FixJ family response regulator
MRKSVRAVPELMPSAEPLRVVIAGAIPLDRLLVRFILQEEGFEVVGESSGGAEAARLVSEHRPDAIVLHGSLTIEGGSHVIPWIRTISPWTKIVLFTPHPDEASVARPEYRADAYLEEGLGLRDLIGALRGLCRPPIAALDAQEEAADEGREGLEGRPGRQSIVRVVLGEAAEMPSGPLRSVLEHEGFDIIGQASNRDELEQVLAATEPTAIVLDATMDAMAVLAAREKHPDAGIVVVWPRGVLAPVADEQVEPSRVYQDLGRNVRRVARLALLRARTIAPTGIETPARARTRAARMRRREPVREPVGTNPVSEGLRRGGVIVLVAAASLILLMVAALALTVPDRLGIVAKSRSPSPSNSVAAPPPRSGGSNGGNEGGNEGGNGVGNNGTKGCGGPSDPIANEAPVGNHGHHGDHGPQGNQGHHVRKGHHGPACRPGNHGHQGPGGSKGHHANPGKHVNGGDHGHHHGHHRPPSHSRRPAQAGR